MKNLLKNTLKAIQNDLEDQYKEIKTNPENYNNPEQLKQELSEQMERIRCELEGRWSR